jgi:hypothetical protein
MHYQLHRKRPIAKETGRPVLTYRPLSTFIHEMSAESLCAVFIML